jgi:transcription antitermination factor NusG
MPIQREEVSLWPDNLLDSPPVEPSELQWWLLYTRSRQEKAVARRLLSHSIPFYCPLVRRTLQYSGRKIHSYVPLFAGYVFMYGPKESLDFAWTTRCLSRVLPVDDQECLRNDLQRIRQLIASNAPLTPESRLVPGIRVRVRAGALLGMEGTVLRRRGEVRLLVAINFIQQGASVLMEDCMLEAID